MPDIAFVKPALPRSGALVLPLAEEAALAGLAKQADEATGGAIARGLEAAKFKGRKGQSATLWAPGAGLSKVVAVGLGKAADIAAQGAEAAGGAIAGAIAQEREAVVAADGLAPALAASLAMGAALKSYRFDRYRTTEKEEDKPKLERIALAVADTAKAKAAYAPMQAVVDGVFLTRDLVSEPPNVLTPAEFAERCRALTKLGVEVEILGPKEMRKLGFGALLGVAQGSAQEPRMVVMKWMGAPKAKKGKPLAFIGKGVTFDTGGISIKPAGGMEDMKWDMAGAGTVAGLMAALAGRKAKADVVGLLGLVENMPSTDAEGRLVLADVIHYCIEKFDPRFMVDLATLTGAIIIALGHEHAGLFSNDDTLASRIEAAGRATGETAWRMPLGEAYDKQIKSDIADMKNVGGRPGGSITAAQFIQRFVQGRPWAHLDIAGTAWSSKDMPTAPKGATAYGVRLLDRLVAEHYEG